MDTPVLFLLCFTTTSATSPSILKKIFYQHMNKLISIHFICNCVYLDFGYNKTDMLIFPHRSVPCAGCWGGHLHSQPQWAPWGHHGKGSHVVFSLFTCGLFNCFRVKKEKKNNVTLWERHHYEIQGYIMLYLVFYSEETCFHNLLEQISHESVWDFLSFPVASSEMQLVVRDEQCPYVRLRHVQCY